MPLNKKIKNKKPVEKSIEPFGDLNLWVFSPHSCKLI